MYVGTAIYKLHIWCLRFFPTENWSFICFYSYYWLVLTLDFQWIKCLIMINLICLFIFNIYWIYIFIVCYTYTCTVLGCSILCRGSFTNYANIFWPNFLEGPVTVKLYLQIGFETCTPLLVGDPPSEGLQRMVPTDPADGMYSKRLQKSAGKKWRKMG